MHQMMLVEHSYAKNMMVLNFSLPFFCIPFWKHKENGAPLEQEAYGVHFAISKWNYYLLGADIIVQNDHKPLTKFLNGKKCK